VNGGDGPRSWSSSSVFIQNAFQGVREVDRNLIANARILAPTTGG